LFSRFGLAVEICSAIHTGIWIGVIIEKNHAGNTCVAELLWHHQGMGPFWHGFDGGKYARLRQEDSSVFYELSYFMTSNHIFVKNALIQSWYEKN